MSPIGSEVYVLAGMALAASAALTLAMRKFALSHGLLDVPNERSSHKNPTPRGGGAAIVATATTGFAVLAALHRLDFAVFAALAGGLAVAAVGFLDDRHALPAPVRLAAHVTAALWALAWLGGLPPLRVGGELISLGAVGMVVGALGIVWVLNLFNFMDGIDGIAASEGTFVAWCGALLTAAAPASSGVTAAAVIFGAACLGFLRWNWPPARIFMGDVGSGYVGYVIAVLAVAGRGDPIALPVWLTLGGTFFADATVTLVRRSLRRERLHEAHRSHAYQWLSRKWGSHRRVTVAAIAVNVLWLLPCAWLETVFPRFAAVIAATALAAVAAAVLGCGAGRSERAHEVLSSGS
jgi:Fuc2NAc and GlcNAc transferase